MFIADDTMAVWDGEKYELMSLNGEIIANIELDSDHLLFVGGIDPYLVDEGIVHPVPGYNFIVDLRQGRVVKFEAPPNFVGQAVYKGKIFGLANESLVSLSITDGNDIKPIPRPAGSKATAGNLTIEGVDQQGIVIRTWQNNQTHLEFWPNMEKEIQFYGPVDFIDSRPLLTPFPDFVILNNIALFAEAKNGSNFLTSLSLNNMSIQWQVPLELPPIGPLDDYYLLANEYMWVVGSRTTDLTNGMVNHQITIGSHSGIIKGEYELKKMKKWHGSLVYPNGDELLYMEDGRIWLARPGTELIHADILLITMGGLLLLTGLAWPVAAPRVFNRVSVGARRRCLYCRSKRTAGMGFCSKCGWRTEDEDTAANPKKREYER